MVRRRLDRRGVDAVGPGGALLDPPRQNVDLLGREAVALALGRHDFLGVIAADEVDELALFGLARRNRLVARVAAGQGPFLDVELEAALTFVAVVALVAVLGKNRSNVFGEI